MMSRTTRYVWAASAALAIVIISVTAIVLMQRSSQDDGLYASLVGGAFRLKTHEGEPISDESLKGKPFAIFFGFTQCPDVCPTSMLELSNLIERLGPDANKMRYLFVSVDPERDTQQLLKEYLSNFDKRLTGIIGTTQEIDDLAKKYRVYYEKVPTSGGYTINHTATVYLMDARGRLASTIAFGEDEDVALKKLQRLIAKVGA